MLVDSHCHINLPGLAERLDDVFAAMAEQGVSHALCAGVTLHDFPQLAAMAAARDNLYISVGLHPEHADEPEPTVEELAKLAEHPKVVAIGETGLDYYWHKGDLEWQRDRFRTHIRAARACGKPLIVHTRDAGADTMRLLEEEGAAEVGGVMHCFTETREIAERALAVGFHISFSGIVTFKNAGDLREVARDIPLDRLLVETDSPYLAPVPFRGKPNQPAYVRYVAEEIARVRALTFDDVARATTANFFRLFLKTGASA